LAKLEAGYQQVLNADREASFAHLEVFFDVQPSLVDFFRGDWTSAQSLAQASRGREPGSSMEGLGVGTLFRQLAYAGDRNGALEILDKKRALLPHSGQANTAGSWLMLALVIEGLVMLGEHSQASQLYPLVCEMVDSGPVVLWPIFRLTHTIVGMAAGSARQWEAAEEHFRIAMQQAEAFPQLLEQAEIRRFHAMMLIDRGARGDREKAQALLREALESYTQIEMPRHIAMAKALLN
jgi:tetratricopeptide (TPR) repeat protein